MKAESKFSALFSQLRAFTADRSGNILMLFAFSAPIALGFAALGTEGGELYWKKVAIQGAADQAAVSAVNSFNSSATAYTVEGKAIAASMGFTNIVGLSVPSGAFSLSTSDPSCGGALVSAAYAVPTFTSGLGLPNITVHASACYPI
jgi:Flp pilus assembly protein TadG